MNLSKRRYAGIVAGIMLVSSIAQTMSAGISAEGGSYDMNVSVNLASSTKSISPYIYGINEYGDNMKNVTATAARQGGNRYTAYNWETNWSNAGEDWHNSSDTNIGDEKNGFAYAARKLSETCVSHNVPYKMTTLQMAGYVAADKNGTVTEEEKAPSARWNEVKVRKDSELSMTPDLDDGVVYMDEYVNYLVNTLGDSTTASGIQGYSLDNEPALWDDTHPYCHGESVSNNELVSKSIELARAVKQLDPNAEIFGPAFWGVLPCVQLSEGDNYKDPEWQAVKSNYSWYIDFYLEQMRKAEEEYGVRLLDVLDVHYYAQDCSTDEARLQAARSLYDESYAENSWLQPYFGQYFPFIVRLKESIDKYYPETKLAFTEYNLGDISNEAVTGKSVSAAIAETEALGAFASNDVYLATYWGTLSKCPYVESAINLYTNYDGEGGNFGDTLVESKTDDISLATAFASVDEGDDSEVTIVLSNKDMSRTENASIKLDGASVSYQSAVVYAITQDHSDIRIAEVQNDIKDNTVNITLPPMSVAQIVISDKPTDKTVYEEPNIETKEVTYQIDELELSVNGYPMIPIEDPEHLKKAVIIAETSSTEGSSWFCGGGGLTFNKLSSESGEVLWGSKSFSYNKGVPECEVIFDGTFTNGDGDPVNASISDTYMEIQNWWASSEKHEDGSDVNVAYKSITLYYEYDNGNPDVSDTTTTTATTTTTTTTTETTTTTTTATAETTTTTVTETTAVSETSDTTTVSIDIPAALYGDVNLDDEVSIIDVVYLNKGIVNIINLNDEQKRNANCCYDDKISTQDSLALLRYLVNNLKSLPIVSE